MLNAFIHSNNKEISDKKVSDVRFPKKWRFEAHSCWKN